MKHVRLLSSAVTQQKASIKKRDRVHWSDLDKGSGASRWQFSSRQKQQNFPPSLGGWVQSVQIWMYSQESGHMDTGCLGEESEQSRLGKASTGREK